MNEYIFKCSMRLAPQGLSHDLEAGCPKLIIDGRPVFPGRPQYTQISTTNIYLSWHNINIQCHGNYMEVKKIQLYARN